MKIQGQCYRTILPTQVFILPVSNPWNEPSLYECEQWGGSSLSVHIKVFGLRSMVFEGQPVKDRPTDTKLATYSSPEEWAEHGYSCLRFGRRQILIPSDHVEKVDWVYGRVFKWQEGWRAELEDKPEQFVTRLLPQWAELGLQRQVPEFHIVFRYPNDV